jgi:hypothetical protein
MRELFKTGGQLVVILLATAALGAARTISMPAPGSVNYVEGEVALEGRSLSEKSVGSAQVEANQVLDTGQGKAELLLTPGVFFRLGDHSKVRMVSAGLANTKVELGEGGGDARSCRLI